LITLRVTIIAISKNNNCKNDSKTFPPTSGRILFEGKDIWKDIRKQEDLKWLRRKVHAVFQDPFASYNPFYPVERTLWQAVNLLEKNPKVKKKVWR